MFSPGIFLRILGGVVEVGRVLVQIVVHQREKKGKKIANNRKKKKEKKEEKMFMEELLVLNPSLYCPQQSAHVRTPEQNALHDEKSSSHLCLWLETGYSISLSLKEVKACLWLCLE